MRRQVLWVAVLMTSTLTGREGRAGWVLVDDFQSYQVAAPLGYYDPPWQCEVGRKWDNYSGGVDWANMDINWNPWNDNQAAAFGEGLFRHVENGQMIEERLGSREFIQKSPELVIPNGQTATLFFRVKWAAEQVDFSIGMTDVADPIATNLFNPFTQFESQFRLSFAKGYDAISIVDAGRFETLPDPVSPNTWYSVWMVIDNAADTTELWIGGGDYFPEIHQLHPGYTFRNSTAGPVSNDLLRLFVAIGRNLDNLPPAPLENIGPVMIDDIYIDHAGRNLTRPVPEPGVLVGMMLVLTVAALLSFRRASPSPHRWLL